LQIPKEIQDQLIMQQNEDYVKIAQDQGVTRNTRLTTKLASQGKSSIKEISE